MPDSKLLNYTCPRCGNLQKKEVSYSEYDVPIECFLSCPGCKAQIIIHYTFNRGVFNNTPMVVRTKERDLSFDFLHFQNSHKKKVKKCN